jgi:hypothetical protein
MMGWIEILDDGQIVRRRSFWGEETSEKAKQER